jgi:haloalkane dehalogenase
MTDIVRTPEDRFAGLPDFDYEPRYLETAEGLRIAYLDEGPADGPPVWFMHGEPTWSFLWRTVFPAVRDAGFRCIVPDMAGFGRSDKPTDFDWYTYDRHTAVMAELLEHLDLRGATMVVHDWGGPVGLRLAVEHADRVDRIVVMDTGLFTGHQKMSDAWSAFRGFVEKTEDLPIGMLVGGACLTPPSPEVLAGYEAPFPDAASKAGARAFPLMIPLTPDGVGAEAGQRVLAALHADDRPVLMLWADQDPILTLGTGRKFAAAIGADEPEVIEGASHFLQEDWGPVIGARIAEWLGAAG